MPRGDGTGPMGMGPMTGWGRGTCPGYTSDGYGMGRNYGCGRGYPRAYAPGAAGYGPRWNYGQNLSVEEERRLLKNRAEFLEEELSQIKKRLSGLD